MTKFESVGEQEFWKATFLAALNGMYLSTAGHAASSRSCGSPGDPFFKARDTADDAVKALRSRT